MLGTPCKMPTLEDYEELLATENCTKEWVTNYQGSGKNGVLLTSVANGNTLFFPYAGYVEGSTLQDVGSDGRYWSASLVDAQHAYVLSIYNNVAHAYSPSRCCGCPVRPVK